MRFRPLKRDAGEPLKVPPVAPARGLSGSSISDVVSKLIPVSRKWFGFSQRIRRDTLYRMKATENGSERLPRRHYTRQVVAAPLGLACDLSGRVEVLLARTLAPTASDTRDMLLGLRRDFGMSRGQLAAALSASEITLRSW